MLKSDGLKRWFIFNFLLLLHLRWGTPEGSILASFTVKAAHPAYLRFGLFCNFLVIFGYNWGDLVFLKGSVKIMEMGNFKDLMLF